jgi:hypothetical protein
MLVRPNGFTGYVGPAKSQDTVESQHSPYKIGNYVHNLGDINLNMEY